MNTEWEQKAIEHALQLRSGMAEEDAAKLAAFNNEQADWFAKCQKCGVELKGTLEQLREHAC